MLLHFIRQVGCFGEELTAVGRTDFLNRPVCLMFVPQMYTKFEIPSFTD